MNVRNFIGIWAIGVTSTLLDSQPVFNLPSTNINITAALEPHLSPNAAIFLPDQADWVNASARWQGYAIPTYQAVVEVATEKDVQQTVNETADRAKVEERSDK